MSLTIVIVVMVILAGIVVISGLDSTQVVDAEKFAMEILNIHTAVDEYYYRYEKYPVGQEYTLNMSNLPNGSISQFSEENIVNNTISFKVIDLSLIGENNTQFGKGIGDDIYVVSENSGKVYYMRGISYEGLTYYTLTGELSKLVGTNINAIVAATDIKVFDVIFNVSNKEYTNQPITVKVKLPNNAIYNSITVTDSKSVSEETIVNGYKVVTINETSENRNGNYTITVNYTYNEIEKTATYAVTNFDNTPPTLKVTEEKQENLMTVKITSEETGSGIKALKYVIGAVANEAYFENYGKAVKNNQFVIDITDYYTIYIEDNASNKNMITTGWIQDGLTVRRGNEVLKVGDFIDYDANVDTYTSTWQVLGAENGELLIISTDDVQTEYGLASQYDYFGGVAKLNALCEAYGKGKGAIGARSIKVEDINKLTGYTPKTDKNEIDALHEFGTEVTYWWTGNEYPYYTSTNGNEGNMSSEYNHGSFWYLDGTVFKESVAPQNASPTAPVKITTITMSGYGYYGNTLTTSREGEEKGLASNSKPYIMLFRNGANTAYSYYWLASTYITADTANALWGMRYVTEGKVTGEPLASSLWPYSIALYRGVRAVVSIGSNVTLTGSSNEGWKVN